MAALTGVSGRGDAAGKATASSAPPAYRPPLEACLAPLVSCSTARETLAALTELVRLSSTGPTPALSLLRNRPVLHGLCNVLKACVGIGAPAARTAAGVGVAGSDDFGYTAFLGPDMTDVDAIAAAVTSAAAPPTAAAAAPALPAVAAVQRMLDASALAVAPPVAGGGDAKSRARAAAASLPLSACPAPVRAAAASYALSVLAHLVVTTSSTKLPPLTPLQPDGPCPQRQHFPPYTSTPAAPPPATGAGVGVAAGAFGASAAGAAPPSGGVASAPSGAGAVAVDLFTECCQAIALDATAVGLLAAYLVIDRHSATVGATGKTPLPHRLLQQLAASAASVVAAVGMHVDVTGGRYASALAGTLALLHAPIADPPLGVTPTPLALAAGVVAGGHGAAAAASAAGVTIQAASGGVGGVRAAVVGTSAEALAEVVMGMVASDPFATDQESEPTGGLPGAHRQWQDATGYTARQQQQMRLRPSSQRRVAAAGGMRCAPAPVVGQPCPDASGAGGNIYSVATTGGASGRKRARIVLPSTEPQLSAASVLLPPTLIFDPLTPASAAPLVQAGVAADASAASAAAAGRSDAGSALVLPAGASLWGDVYLGPWNNASVTVGRGAGARAVPPAGAYTVRRRPRVKRTGSAAAASASGVSAAGNVAANAAAAAPADSGDDGDTTMAGSTRASSRALAIAAVPPAPSAVAAALRTLASSAADLTVATALPAGVCACDLDATGTANARRARMDCAVCSPDAYAVLHGDSSVPGGGSGIPPAWAPPSSLAIIGGDAPAASLAAITALVASARASYAAVAETLLQALAAVLLNPGTPHSTFLSALSCLGQLGHAPENLPVLEAKVFAAHPDIMMVLRDCVRELPPVLWQTGEGRSLGVWKRFLAAPPVSADADAARRVVSMIDVRVDGPRVSLPRDFDGTGSLQVKWTPPQQLPLGVQQPLAFPPPVPPSVFMPPPLPAMADVAANAGSEGGKSAVPVAALAAAIAAGSTASTNGAGAAAAAAAAAAAGTRVLPALLEWESTVPQWVREREVAQRRGVASASDGQAADGGGSPDSGAAASDDDRALAQLELEWASREGRVPPGGVERLKAVAAGRLPPLPAAAAAASAASAAGGGGGGLSSAESGSPDDVSSSSSWREERPVDLVLDTGKRLRTTQRRDVAVMALASLCRVGGGQHVAGTPFLVERLVQCLGTVVGTGGIAGMALQGVEALATFPRGREALAGHVPTLLQLSMAQPASAARYAALIQKVTGKTLAVLLAAATARSAGSGAAAASAVAPAGAGGAAGPPRASPTHAP